MKRFAVDGWRWAALACVLAVLIGVAVGRPNPTRLVVTEVARPSCSGSETLSGALPQATVVFTGTVTNVSPTEVQFATDRVYRGAPDFSRPDAVIYRTGWDGLTWTVGSRYIVVGSNGRLRECQESQPWQESSEQELRRFYK